VITLTVIVRFLLFYRNNIVVVRLTAPNHLNLKMGMLFPEAGANLFSLSWLGISPVVDSNYLCLV
jgi:hypothetical protein